VAWLSVWGNAGKTHNHSIDCCDFSYTQRSYLGVAQLVDLAALKTTFDEHGYVVVPSFADVAVTQRFQLIAQEHLATELAPMEYEVDVQYPGAPADAAALGANTARRLLQACSRHSAFRDWATSDAVKRVLAKLLGSEALELSQCHHNCVMTKQPGFSSATLWHQDNRYWSFDEQNLVSLWLALTDEHRRNGCLRVIPGSHRLSLDPGRFDAALFLRPDLPENKQLLKRAVQVTLRAGDALFFHSKLFHAAGRNQTDTTKLSLVFTYHAAANRPIDATRSARFPGIAL